MVGWCSNDGNVQQESTERAITPPPPRARATHMRTTHLPVAPSCLAEPTEHAVVGAPDDGGKVEATTDSTTSTWWWTCAWVSASQ
jgi:hypothetical protein